jgi:ATP-binding cassette, subfamily B, bacterial MsbA
MDVPPKSAPTRRLITHLLRHRIRIGISVLLALAVSLFSAVTVGALVPFMEVILEKDGLRPTILRLAKAGGALGAAAAEWIEEAVAADPFRSLVFVVVILVVVTVLKGVLTFLHDYLVTAVCQRAQLDLAEELFDRLTEHDESTLSRVGLSNVSARFSYDLDISGKAMGTLIGTLILEPARFLAYLGVALVMSAKLTLAAVVLVPGFLVAARVLGRRIRKSAENMLEKRAQLLGRVQETVAALPVVQVYGQEEHERARFRGATGRAYSWAKRLARLEAVTSPMMEVAGVCGTAPVLLFGGWMVLQGEMTAAVFVAFITVLASLYAPLRKAVGASNRMQGGIAGAARIFAVMDLRSEVRERAGAESFPPVAETIEWRQVTVTYPDGRTALDGVSLRAPAGKTTALVGKSGSGKTTLLHTLPRLLDPSGGSVRLDGRDIGEATLASLRGRMAIVTQDARLFAGTLAENVAYARPDATKAEIEAAATAARVDEIVARLPAGWDTHLDETGKGLSGGERQRIAIARAVLRDPEILLLDEPTSSLDPENERLVREALAALAQGRTTLVVAHRRETVEAADHVVVLRGGHVEAEGAPAEVAGNSPTYRELFGGG